MTCEGLEGGGIFAIRLGAYRVAGPEEQGGIDFRSEFVIIYSHMEDDMLGLIMIFSFAAPLAAALSIRRYTWIGICLALVALVAIPVLTKVISNSQDPMGWGFAMVLVFVPALVGAGLGSLITGLRRWRSGPGKLSPVNMGLGGILSAAAVAWGLFVASDF